MVWHNKGRWMKVHRQYYSHEYHWQMWLQTYYYDFECCWSYPPLATTLPTTIDIIIVTWYLYFYLLEVFSHEGNCFSAAPETAKFVAQFALNCIRIYLPQTCHFASENISSNSLELWRWSTKLNSNLEQLIIHVQVYALWYFRCCRCKNTITNIRKILHMHGFFWYCLHFHIVRCWRKSNFFSFN